jgi:transposase InsO family protein
LALVELSVVEQRYRAVLEAAAGVPVSEVAARYEVSRQSVHAWIRRYERGGLGALMDRSRRPESCPHQISVEVEAVVCELRREHPRWGPLMLGHELGKRGVSPVPSRMSIYRVLVRHGLIDPRPRKRPRDSYRRWEREAPMALWQLDIVGGVFLADGTEAKIVTGVDDHSRYCVICQVVARATGRAVCLAFVAALRRYGVPAEVLTDNGKQFTDRFGKGGEVLFDRICRDNGIIHRLTQPRHPTTTGKVERFHGSLRREKLNEAVPFPDLAAAQAAVDGWVSEYNTTRPHQSLSMASPAERFSTTASDAERDLLPLRLPPVIPAAVPPPPASEPGTGHAPASTSAEPAPWREGPVEFDRVVPASGNLMVARRQFWLGPRRAGTAITFWASTEVIHVLSAGSRIKSVRSHLAHSDLARLAATGGRAAGPPPLPPAAPGSALEVERVASAIGHISLGGRQLLAAEALTGRLLGIRIDQATLTYFDPVTRELLRTRPSPLTWDQAQRLRGARQAGPPPVPATSPVTVQRRASNSGVIMVVGQKIALGRIHARKMVSVRVSPGTLTIEIGADDIRTVRRTTDQPIRNLKAQRARKPAKVS